MVSFWMVSALLGFLESSSMNNYCKHEGLSNHHLEMVAEILFKENDLFMYLFIKDLFS